MKKKSKRSKERKWYSEKLLMKGRKNGRMEKGKKYE
jgi:hypothetical protein